MVRTNDHVKSLIFKLAIFLAQGAWLAAAVNQAIQTIISFQILLLSHLRAVEARV